MFAANASCQPEIYSQVIWDVKNAGSLGEIQSDPLCLSELKFNVIRKCDAVTGEWHPKQAPHCAHRQKAFEKSELCPLNYRTIHRNQVRLCVLLTEPKMWQNECMFDGSSSVFYHLDESEQRSLIDYLMEMNVTEVWLPAMRYARYGPVVWTVLGSLRGEQVEFDKLNIDLVNALHQNDGHDNGDGCLSAFVQTNLMTASIRNCSDKLRVLCAYRLDDDGPPLMKLACPKESFTVPYQSASNLCYSIRSIEKSTRPLQRFIDSECNGHLFTMDSVETIKIFKQLAHINNLRINERCLFAVAPGNVYIANRTEWQRRIDAVNYVNWDYPILNGSIVATNMHGKWNWIDGGSGAVDCIACATPIELHRPELALNFIKNVRRLYLTIYNPEFLWQATGERPGVKCFTNADDELIKTVELSRKSLWSSTLSLDQINRKDHARSRLRKKSKAIYELKLYGEGPGYYWCEGYTMLQFQRIESAKIVAFRRDRGEVFATAIKTQCTACHRFVLKHFVKSNARRLRDHLKDVYKLMKHSANHSGPSTQWTDREINIENVRIMQIESISSKMSENQTRTAQILYHITVSLERHRHQRCEPCRVIETATMLRQILEHMELIQSERSYEFVSMNSTEYCLPDRMPTVAAKANNTLSAAIAKIGETIPLNEMCLLPSGLPALQRCVGDFLYGGIWLAAGNNECHVQPNEMTKSLFQIAAEMSISNQIDGRAMHNISQMVHMSAQKLGLVAADIFYLGRIMSDFSRLSSNNNNDVDVEGDGNDGNDENNKTNNSYNHSNRRTFNLNDTQHVFSIYNDLMYLNEHTTRKSATLNSTNILLDAFDNILNGIQIDITSAANDDDAAAAARAAAVTAAVAVDAVAHDDRNQMIQVNSDDGTITTQTPNLIVYVIDPSIKNISGVALIKKTTQQQPNDERHDLTDYYIKTLYANQSSDELLNETNLEVATFVPAYLLTLLNASSSSSSSSSSTNATSSTAPVDDPMPLPQPIRIVISIYNNDRLFQDVQNERRVKSAGKIISVSIPGYGSNLPSLLPTFLKSHAPENYTSSMCGYWNFESEYATWSDDGCEFISKSQHLYEPIVLCACSHLTHYSYLIVGTHFQSVDADGDEDDDDVIVTKTHEKALDMITLLGCLLSLLGVCGISVTAIFFRTWRQKPSSIVLLQLSGAIALQMILLCFVNTEYSAMYLIIERKFIACVVLGALLQYSILVAFSWMFITAHLQFVRYVIVLGPQRSNRFFLKTFLMGWGLPLIPVVIVVALAPDSYVQSVTSTMDNYDGICYPSGTSLYFGLIAPIGMIIVANLIIFILIIYHILIGPNANIRSTKRTMAIAQLRLSVFLFFLLGLSWIFGFLASIKSGIIFSYLFCLTATIQGFVLFIYFIILDSNTRKLWQNFFQKSF